MSAQVVYIGLGANLGDRAATMARAVAQLTSTPGVRLNALSSIYESEPEGGADQPSYLNAVAEFHTTLSAVELLDLLMRTEIGLGRDRTAAAPASPRTIDLDMLLYGELALCAPGLEIPHPRMTRRGFVLMPLSEIAPSASIPGQTLGVHSLLLALGSAALPSLARAEAASGWSGPFRKET